MKKHRLESSFQAVKIVVSLKCRHNQPQKEDTNFEKQIPEENDVKILRRN